MVQGLTVCSSPATAPDWLPLWKHNDESLGLQLFTNPAASLPHLDLSWSILDANPSESASFIRLIQESHSGACRGAKKAGMSLQLNKAVSTRSWDFWTMGGASLVLCLGMILLSFFRESSVLIQQRFALAVPVFAFFSLLCNYPHFLISYRFGYGRGSHFILKHWFALIFVPVFLIVLYSISFFWFNFDVLEISWSSRLLQSIDASIPRTIPLGPLVMGFTVWLMYLTVGWHYSKQVYGCMMVYNRLDGYGLNSVEKLIVRISLLSLSLFQFVMSTQIMEQQALAGYRDPRMSGVAISTVSIPDWIYYATLALAIAFGLLAVGVAAKKYFYEQKKPSINFVIPWVALYLWWLPMLQLPEFYVLAVPFFHSLQYLPFALKVESSKIAKDKSYHVTASLRLGILVVLGFLFFEIIPTTLDLNLQSSALRTDWFFFSAFVVFLNVHHFFIDSVAWRISDSNVQGLLGLKNAPVLEVHATAC